MWNVTLRVCLNSGSLSFSLSLVKVTTTTHCMACNILNFDWVNLVFAALSLMSIKQFKCTSKPFLGQFWLKEHLIPSMEPLKWCNIHDLYTTDTSLIQTICSVPSVSVLERFHCMAKWYTTTPQSVHKLFTFTEYHRFKIRNTVQFNINATPHKRNKQHCNTTNLHFLLRKI